MGASAKCQLVGFAIGSGTGNVSYTGMGFTSKASIFSWSGQTTNQAVSNFLSKRGVGFAISSSSRAVVTTHSEGGSATGDTGQGQSATKCIYALNDSEGNDGDADFVSNDADGGTVNRTTAFGINFRVDVWGIAGSAVKNVVIGSFLDPASASTTTVTPGIATSALFMMGIGASAATGTDSRMFFGMASKTGLGNCVLCNGSNNGNNPTQSISYCNDVESIALFDPNTTFVNERARVTAYTSTTFDVTWDEVNGAGTRTHYYLAIEGGNWSIGNLMSQTTTAVQTVSGLPYAPSGGCFLSANAAKDAVDTPHDSDMWSLGFIGSEGGIVSGGPAILDPDNITPTVVTVSVDTLDFYNRISGAPAFTAYARANVLQSDGFTWHMQVAEPSAQAFVPYMLFGEPYFPPIPGPHPYHPNFALARQ